MSSIQRAHFILFVPDQALSTVFFIRVLECEPHLNAPGMTEFGLPGGGVLGLMPESGARRLLGPRFPEAGKTGAPQAELYLVVDDPASSHARALAAGATELSPLADRDWGHEAAYSLTPDGHVLAFARALAHDSTLASDPRDR